MSFVHIWVYAVWGTKNRVPLLAGSVHDLVCQNIRENARLKDISIDTINGHHDHLHCLMLMNPEMSISKHLQLIKGENSFWINKNKITKYNFDWAKEYFAVSVSEDKLESVWGYIRNQQELHKKITFLEEYKKFLEYFRFMPG